MHAHSGCDKCEHANKARAALLAAAEEVIAYVDASGDVPESIHGLLRAAISQARGEA